MGLEYCFLKHNHFLIKYDFKSNKNLILFSHAIKIKMFIPNTIMFSETYRPCS